MYTDGTLDLMMMIVLAAFKPPEEKEENVAFIVTKAKTRYFPVFEKVGNRDPSGQREALPSGDQQYGGRPDAPATQEIQVDNICVLRSWGCGGHGGWS